MSKILYVEDHPSQREILAQMLELNGFEVATASDGVDGVELARTWKPDLILMDLRMPRMDGFEAIKILRNTPQTTLIPIIVVSAWASRAHHERAFKVGCDEHYTKPVNLHSMLEAINKYLAIDPEELERRRGKRQAQEAKEVEKPQMSPPQQSEDLGRAFSATKHDLVGLLGMIQQDVETMLITPPTPDKLRRIWRSARHSILLLQNVADLRPGGTLYLEVHHLPDLVEEALNLIEPEFKDRIHVNRNYEQKLPGVKLEPLRFEQVLLNLFKNAREAQANTLNISIKKSRDDNLILTITDNGLGIKEEDFAHLFELWHTTRTGVGRGLGLYIVKTVLDRHGWEIKVDSRPRQGTTFSITIPPDSLTEPITSPSKTPDKNLIFSTPNVLVIDDNADTLDLLKDSLESLNYRLTPILSLSEGIDLLSHEDYDVVVTDLRFLEEEGEYGELAGLRVLEVAYQANPPTKVIIATGFGSETLAQKAMQSGAYDYITKPINFKRLQISIRKAIEARRRLLDQQHAPAQAGDTPLETISIIGNSPAMAEVIEKVQMAASSHDTVLLRGEGGTGKSFVAETIHSLSRRRAYPIQAINCTALIAETAENIRETWLDSLSTRLSIFGQNVEGSIFLESVEDLRDDAQRMLFKFMEQIESDPDSDVQIISSLGERRQDHLRPELRRRLSEIEIFLPPLRERREDIPALVGHFLRKYSLEYGVQVEMAQESIALLQEYSYPDNVVELERIVKFAARRARQGIIEPSQLPREIQQLSLTDASATRVESLKRQLQKYYTHLNILEERQAKYGLDVPVSLISEIDAIKEQIERIESELAQLEE